jgi:hypothetical protein
VLGYLAISRGVIIEPPAMITNLVNAIVERTAQRGKVAVGRSP